VFSGIPYDTAAAMDFDEFYEANAALDLHIEQTTPKAKGGGKRGS
jgi:hypothetical protein